jgi:VanZ family protein
MGKVVVLLRSTFPTHFVALVGGMVATAVIVAIVTALLRIDTRKAARYGALAAALAIGVGYSVASRTGTADTDAVERFHFVEYGVITILFYRAWRARGDASAFVLPVLAALVVSSCDEWLQWFVPVRVGELHDVLLNLVAICCGLLVGAAVEPPAQFSTRLRPKSVAAICVAGAVALLVFAAFVSAAHLGYGVDLGKKGAGLVFPGDQTKNKPGPFFPGTFFRSHYTSAQLDALSHDRASRWRTDPPVVFKRYSQEDQYMDEGLWHIRRRNADWTAGEYFRAWNENLILETFFAPVLDTSTYALPDGGRWPAEQRVDAARRAAEAAPSASPFVSDAQPYPIFIWPKPLFWGVVAGVILVAFACAWRAWAAASR